ncbi:DNA topoisomerase (ATP-hydrolyzing) subunit A [Vibrio sp. D431a]|uniref:DNA gyrase/topoisomerase IV subunit A n=1 Tax=Vibrio sp. D431a TaxID=2837388 RepID=UPI002552F401|nr:DNA gyrase subunit A [Vibrio sp. D431a]MDK9793876.1 hypothetical protein [Vibrio sp. D431a]
MSTEQMSSVDTVMHQTDDKFEMRPITDAVREPFLIYATSVIKERALPDERDGLKPVHRRILFGQSEMGNHYNKAYKKSARVVGEVMGKYHPHGDSAIYESLVRMAQGWSMSAPLADGQGNFGSRDGDSAAAMRYTEVRMTKISDSMIEDLAYDTVGFVPNYDGSEHMPEVFPTRFPNLIINGGEGIAVGMASKIPTHNPIEALRCVIELTKARLEGTEVALDDLMNIMPAPDFPTGGLIHGLTNYEDAWRKGRCKFKARGEWEDEMVDGRRAVVITSLPFAVNKADLVAKLDELRKEKDGIPAKINGILSVSDVSNIDNPVRIIVKLKSGYDPEIVFNDMCKQTVLEKDFSYNITVIRKGKPVTVGILDTLNSFIDFREEVIVKRSNYLLQKALSKKHSLAGLMKAIDRLDETISTIRNSKTGKEANDALRELLSIDEGQAASILNMRLQNLASTQINDIKEDYNGIIASIEEYEGILASRAKQLEVLIEESEEQIDKFANYKDPQNNKVVFNSRRSKFQRELISINREDLITREDCSIVMSSKGFIRRIPSSEIDTQKRGTKGKMLMTLGRGDYIQQTTVCHSHDTLAFISDKGLVSFVRAFDIDTGARGSHINNTLKLSDEENIILFKTISEDQLQNAENLYAVIGTNKGYVKKTRLSKYSPKRRVAVRTINERHLDNEKVIFFGIASENSDICLVSSGNRSIRHSINDLLERSRTAGGVRSMSLLERETIQSGAIVEHDDVDKSLIGCVTKSGILKISKLSDYKIQRRGGKGIIAMNVTDDDYVLSSFIFTEGDEIDVVTTTKRGVVNRIPLSGIRVTSRRTKGVKLINIDKKKDELVTALLATSEMDTSEQPIEFTEEVNSNVQQIDPMEIEE